MRPFFVVFANETLCDGTHLVQAVEHAPLDGDLAARRDGQVLVGADGAFLVDVAVGEVRGAAVRGGQGLVHPGLDDHVLAGGESHVFALDRGTLVGDGAVGGDGDGLALDGTLAVQDIVSGDGHVLVGLDAAGIVQEPGVDGFRGQ